MSTIRLFYGRNKVDMVKRLRDAARRAEGSLGCPSTHPHVSRLEVRETVLEDEVIDAIVDLIQKGGVNTVNLDDCGAYLNKQAVQMARALGQCKDVRLSEPTFLTKFFLESFLVSATRLESLRIQDRFLTDQVEALVKGLSVNTTLKVLDLSRSRLLENAATILAEGLQHNTSLRSLKLRSLGLKDEDVATMLSCLASHPTLAVLDLSFNFFRDMGAVATFLRTNIQLRELLLGYQNMWQSAHLDVTELAAALRENRSLKTLSLARCKLNDQDAIILANALRENYTLVHLDLSDNLLGDAGIVALARAIGDENSNCALRKLSVLKNRFGSEGSLALLEAAKTNWNLFHVDSTRSSRNCEIGRQIRFYTALNRGGRKLLVQHPRLPIWPLVIERIGKLDWNAEDDVVGGSMQLFEDDDASPQRCGNPGLDVTYYLLRRGPPLFEGGLTVTTRR